MPRLRQEYEKEDGWTRWVFPVMNGYRMACCDCGLVHDLQFDILAQGRERKSGEFTVTNPKTRQKLRVAFRVRRNNRSTALTRRKARKRG